MAYRHGVFAEELATGVVTPTPVGTGIPVVIGAAPVHLSSTRPYSVNVPELFYTLADAQATVGYGDDWRYSLNEFLYCHFRINEAAPVVLVNVLDPANPKHIKPAPATSLPVTDGVLTLPTDALADTLRVQGPVPAEGAERTIYAAGTDYITTYNAQGELVVTLVPESSGGTIPAGTSTLDVSFSQLDPTAVTAEDIMGGIDSATGTKTGLEVVNDVFPRYGIVAGEILAPGYSSDPVLATLIQAKAGNLNGQFACLGLVDAPADTLRKYSDVPGWKTDHVVDSHMLVLWPCAKVGDKVSRMSSHVPGVIQKTDATLGRGAPYYSPSNKDMGIQGICLADGTPVWLDNVEAQYLNGQGIVTARRRMMGGWALWGPQTSAYPTTTDVKDADIAVRRMIDWIQTTAILTLDRFVDDPLNKRLIKTVTNSLNRWLSGLVSVGALLGGRIEFVESENPVTSLLAGISCFHLYVTPPPTGKEIMLSIEYDPSYLQALFEA